MSVYERDTAPLFERALESISAQDYVGGPVRLYVCVDGPLRPETAAVLERHARLLHRVLHNNVNQGLARSLNRMLDALGDEAFVFRMDSDDFAHPRRITVQVEALKARPDIDIIGSAIREVNRDGNVLRVVRYPESCEEVRRLIARRNPLAHPTVCFRRSAIACFRGYPLTKMSQDWALWFECLAMGLRLANVRDPLVDMTVTEEFFRRRGVARAFEEFRISCLGIRRLYGVSWRYVYPLVRLAFRLLPQPLIRLAYGSRLR
jgi:glycosyltransferase involved in cell wall biosynthesis